MSISRPCPVCASAADRASPFLDKNIDASRLSDFSFASRKSPEYMCHHMVRCQVCDLVYADAPPPESELAQAYHTAAYDSTEEANDAAKAYAVAIAPILNRLAGRQAALEIGTGTGIFLEHLQQAGFQSLLGVEPSSAAIAAAPASRRAWIREGMFNEADFQPASFDLICCFMTMEHVRDPKVISESALRLLKPGGAFITVTHDYRSVVNRLLGKRSPIIDIEHLQIFSRPSMEALFTRTGFEEVTVKSFVNRYSLRYWLRLSPIPAGLKRLLERLASSAAFKSARVGLNVGNMIAAGFRKA